MTDRILGVDCHAHVTRRNATLDPMRHSEPEVDVGAGDYMAVLGAHGLSHGVLTAPSFYGTDNSMLLQALAEFPQYLRGVVNVDPAIDRETLLQWNERGVVGVRFNLIRRARVPDFSDRAYQQLFRFLGRIGWHVEVYIESERFAEVITPIVRSGVRMVFDHFGSPTEPEGLSGRGFQAVIAAVRRGEVWVKLSAPYRIPHPDLRAFAQALLDAGGPGCLLWGSDWPWVSHAATVRYPDCLAGLQAWVPDPGLRARILCLNPRVPFRL